MLEIRKPTVTRLEQTKRRRWVTATALDSHGFLSAPRLRHDLHHTAGFVILEPFFITFISESSFLESCKHLPDSVDTKVIDTSVGKLGKNFLQFRHWFSLGTRQRLLCVHSFEVFILSVCIKTWNGNECSTLSRLSILKLFRSGKEH